MNYFILFILIDKTFIYFEKATYCAMNSFAMNDVPDDVINYYIAIDLIQKNKSHLKYRLIR